MKINGFAILRIVFAFFSCNCHAVVDTNYSKASIVYIANDLIEMRCDNQIKAFDRNNIDGINNFAGKYFTFDGITDQTSSNHDENTINRIT